MQSFFYSKHKVFILAVIMFAFGIAVASFSWCSVLFLQLSFAAGLFILGVGAYLHLRSIAVVGLLMLGFACGAWRLQSSIVPSEFQNDFEQKIQFEGVVIEDPDIRSNTQLLTIRPFGKTQNVLATVRLSDKYFYGDWVTLSGKIQEAKNFDDFDYKSYLERYNIYAVLSYPKVLILKNHRGNFFKEQLLRVKHAFTNRISTLVPEPQASLLFGILIGAKKTLPQSVVDDFIITGTSHVIAVSGFNITIIISSLAFLAYVLGRRVHFWISILFIFSFVVITGASASVVRAAVMGVLCLYALRIGRQYAMLGALFFSAFVMLVINPKILNADIGFQLSFAATLGIILTVPLVKVADKESSWFGVRDTLITTLAAIFATLPLLMVYFGIVSLVSPIVNILILPFLVPYTMLIGFLIVLPFVGSGFAFVANALLQCMLFIVHVFAHLPHASVQIRIPAWGACMLYILLAAVYLLLRSIAGKKENIGVTQGK